MLMSVIDNYVGSSISEISTKYEALDNVRVLIVM